MPLQTAAQYEQPSILGAIQTGLRSRGEIQRQGILTREEENLARLRDIQEAQQAEQRGLLQRARGVEGISPEEATQQEAINLYYANNPDEGAKVLKVLGIERKEQVEDLAADADNMLNATTNEERLFLIDERARKISARGGNPTDTLELKDLLRDDPANFTLALRGAKAAALTEFQRSQLGVGYGSTRAGAGEKAFQPVTLVNKAGEKILVNPVFDPRTGKSRLEEASIPEGYTISRETAPEKRAADIATVGAKKGAEITGKKIAERRQVAVDQGLTSSEGFANVARARALLDTVKTGGFSNAALRAKQVFGIESADEAELSNRLGKSVLSQLRQTFGAAFTAEEGASLARIEAGFGKSTKGNRQLLDQAMKLINKKADEGIKAAVASKDFSAAQRIQDNLDFTLDIGEGDLNIQEQAELEELRRRFE